MLPAKLAKTYQFQPLDSSMLVALFSAIISAVAATLLALDRLGLLAASGKATLSPLAFGLSFTCSALMLISSYAYLFSRSQEKKDCDIHNTPHGCGCH